MGQLLETINNIAPIGDLSERASLVTFWLLPTKILDFKSLELKYRETIMTKQSLWNKTFDSSVILDVRVGNYILHHQSGAMKKSQLQDEYIEFKLRDIPNVFIFLMASISSKKMVTYKSNEINNFLKDSFEHCSQHSKLFENIWRELL